MTSSALVVALAIIGQTADETECSFPTFGISIRAPAGWEQIAEESAGQIARFRKGEIVLAIEVEPKPKETPAAFARRLGLEKMGATKLASEDAHFYEGEAGEIALIANHGGSIYTLRTSQGGEEALESVRSTWKWLEIAPPSGHLGLRADRAVILGTRSSIQLPAIARPYSQKDPEIWGIYNYLVGRVDVFLQFDIPKAGESRDSLANRIAELWGLDEAPEWESTEDRYVAGPIELTDDGKPRQPPSFVQWVLVPGNLLMTFAIRAEQETNRAAYRALADRVTQSLRSEGETPAAKPPKEIVGTWRHYESRIVYDVGGAGAMSRRGTHRLVLSEDGTWTFGSSTGKVKVLPITEKDWEAWGIADFGAKRKIVLEGWSKSVAGGPIEEESGTVNFVWVIARIQGQRPGAMHMKFGQ